MLGMKWLATALLSQGQSLEGRQALRRQIKEDAGKHVLLSGIMWAAIAKWLTPGLSNREALLRVPSPLGGACLPHFLSPAPGLPSPRPGSEESAAISSPQASQEAGLSALPFPVLHLSSLCAGPSDGQWFKSPDTPGPLAHNRTLAHCLTLMDANVFSMSRCSLACEHMLSVAARRATGRSSWPCPLDPPARLGLLTPGYDSRCCLSCSMKSACQLQGRFLSQEKH